MKKWEYLEATEDDLQGSRLKSLGEEGWELVCVIERINYRGNFVYIFKREIT